MAILNTFLATSGDPQKWPIFGHFPRVQILRSTRAENRHFCKIAIFWSKNGQKVKKTLPKNHFLGRVFFRGSTFWTPFFTKSSKSSFSPFFINNARYTFFEKKVQKKRKKNTFFLRVFCHFLRPLFSPFSKISCFCIQLT